MNKLWIVLPLLAIVFGCNTSPSPSELPAEGESSNASAEPTVADDTADTEYTSTETSDPEAAESSEPQQPSTEPSGEDLADDQEQQNIKQEINSQLTDALRQGDLSGAVTILETARAKLPNDPDVGMALLSIRIQNDFRLAAEADREAALKSMARTTEAIEEVLGPDGELPAQLAAYWQLNEARRHAQAEKIDAAVASLNQAFDKGFTQISALRQDPFFEPIAEHEKFQQALEAGQEKLKAHYRELARQEFAEAETFDFDFELKDLQDNPVKLSDFKGKVVIVDIWGTWCPPCRMEIPHFIDLKNEYKDDLAIVGITYERTQDLEQAKKQIAEFVQAEGVNYPCVIGDEATQEAVQVEGFPTTLFIDHTGKVRLKIVGYHPHEKLEGYVAELVAERRAAKPSS